MKQVLTASLTISLIIIFWTIFTANALILESGIAKMLGVVDTDSIFTILHQEKSRLQSRVGVTLTEPNLMLTYNCEYNNTNRSIEYLGVYYFEKIGGMGESSVIVLCLESLGNNEAAIRKTIKHELYHQYQHEYGLPESEADAVKYSETPP